MKAFISDAKDFIQNIILLMLEQADPTLTNPYNQKGAIQQKQVRILVNDQVKSIYNKLNSEVEMLDSKILAIVNEHQGEFILAYQNHMKKIKDQLQVFKSRLDNQQNQLKGNNKILYLEKQASLFRQQCLKLYDRLQSKTQEAEIYKCKSKDLEKTNFIMMREIRQVLKTKKGLQAKIASLQYEKAQLQSKLSQTVQENTKLQQQKSIILSVPKKTETLQSNQSFNLKLRLKQSTKLSSSSKVSNDQFRRKKSYSFANVSKDLELKDWFLDCIKAVKRQVATRKNNHNIDFNDISSISDFLIIDKLRLLQKFLENQKLLVWMYEKIFPSRINQVKQYLSNRNLSNEQTLYDSRKEFKQNSAMMTDQSLIQLNDFESGKQKQDFLLPKMGNKYHVSNRTQVKKGKLRVLNQ